MEPRRAAPGAHGWGPRVAAGSGTAAELVYHLAGALGTELKELARRFGPEAAAGLVPLVVQSLELLEKAAVGPAPDSLQVSAQQAELELRRLREENERLRRELRSGPQEERALLRQLKEVTDRQRDELRAHNRDLLQRSQETEALQEQLQRLLLVNAELRHKLAAVQAQLSAARDRESQRELQGEAAKEWSQERGRDQAEGPRCDQRQEPELAANSAGAPATPEDSADTPLQPERPYKVGQCGFSREEVEQILQERNELKANVFLLKEELAYFQRELLTDHRVPELLLEAMKVAVRKQRKKIKAKMLGIPEEAESSDDEDGSWLLLSSDKGDHPQPPPPESRIRSLYVRGRGRTNMVEHPLPSAPILDLPGIQPQSTSWLSPSFGLWYRGEAEAPEAETSSVAPSKRQGEEEAPQPPHLEPVGSLTDPNS
ncbi:rab-interacting lysosomal protein isoform X1 [Camelus dromedarius]|uniref:Rab-interacting lysosomal protein n=1 Tax=Camelus ferus TaxID=419612 RepID=A0A8B8R623_CAMFR|nr:rab-interacting lysosomal protein isoform X3 [Camelus dromedarius]XP_032313377.1 rab-interacting lysosomal protein isoform X1 [Camelus ferus]